MNKKNFFRGMLAIVSAVMLSVSVVSCFSSKPSSFVKATDGGTWTSIYIRDGLTYDKSFNEVMDIVSSRFEMDMISKEGGYGRTNWIYTWNDRGKYTEKYRTRVIFKFSSDRTKVNIKTEAEFGGEPKWVRGFDTRLLETIKRDIMGVVGNTTL